MPFNMLVLSVIVASAVPRASPPSEAKVQMNRITRALDMFWVDCGRYPVTEEGLQFLVEAPYKFCEGHWGPEYLKAIPFDPWGHAWTYESETGGHFVLRSLGADGLEGGVGENTDLVYHSRGD